MLNIHKPKTRTTYNVRVVDDAGQQEIFDSVAEVAKLMGVTKQAVYIAISRQITICGCRVYKVED